jgi:hypothetical protein
MNTLNTFERSVLEILSFEPATIDEITRKTGIGKLICQKILQDLLEKKIIQTNGMIFQISEIINSKLLNEINSPEYLNLELLEYIEAVIENRSTHPFKFKKISISECDYKLLGAMLSNIDSFLKEAEKSAKSHHEFQNQKIIFWGAGDLQNINNQMLKSAI